jgi:hypothetical protein
MTAGLTASLAELPAAVWVWACFTLLLAAALGFAAGAYYGRHATDRLLRRARRRVSQLAAAVMGTLETAQQACWLLQQAGDVLLTAEQLQQLDRKKSRLLESLAAVIERQRPPAAASSDNSPPADGNRPAAAFAVEMGPAA